MVVKEAVAMEAAMAEAETAEAETAEEDTVAGETVAETEVAMVVAPAVAVRVGVVEEVEMAAEVQVGGMGSEAQGAAKEALQKTHRHSSVQSGLENQSHNSNCDCSHQMRQQSDRSDENGRRLPSPIHIRHPAHIRCPWQRAVRHVCRAVRHVAHTRPQHAARLKQADNL